MAQTEPLTRTPGFCALCKSRCGSLMVTRDGRFIGQEPNPDHPTGQALCIKGRAAAEIIYSPQRQLYPLKRTRPKGDPDAGWQRISWEEALERTASQLDRIRSESGPEAVAFGCTTPSGTPISDDLRWIERFINAFGSPNLAYGTEICNWHKDFAHAYTFGRSIASPDFAASGCIVLWGHNPSATWLDHATAVGAARSRGARLVVVDPRRAGFAARADQWLRVRPGADGALALGIAGEMIRNGWFERRFHARLDQRPLAGAGGHAALPARRRPCRDAGRRQGRRSRRLGCARAPAARLLAVAARLCRRRVAGTRRVGRRRLADGRTDPVPLGLRSLSRALRRLSARACRRRRLGGGKPSDGNRETALRGPSGQLLRLVRRRPAHQRHADGSRHRHPDGADRQLRCARRQCRVRPPAGARR